MEEADGRTLEGEITCSGGGVGRNIADALTKLGAKTHFISAIGDDPFGEFLSNQTLSHLKSSTLIKGKERTPVCMVVCDNDGNSRLLVGDMSAHRQMDPSAIEKYQSELVGSSLVVLDGNVPLQGMEYIFKLCRQHQIPVFFEPTDVVGSQKAFQTTSENTYISFISPNKAEFVEIIHEVYPNENLRVEDSIESLAYFACKLAEQKVHNVLVTLGPQGVLVARRGTQDSPIFSVDENPRLILHNLPVSHRLYAPPPFPTTDIVNVSGAGDCFASGYIAAMLKGLPERICVDFGFRASHAALRSAKTVPDDLSGVIEH